WRSRFHRSDAQRQHGDNSARNLQTAHEPKSSQPAKSTAMGRPSAVCAVRRVRYRHQRCFSASAEAKGFLTLGLFLLFERKTDRASWGFGQSQANLTSVSCP